MLILSLCTSAQPQKDTLYFNRKWQKTTKDSAAFYRYIVKENNLFKVEDYYLNGKLQMTGTYSSLDPDIKEGKFTYYSEKGIIYRQFDYVDNEARGYGYEKIFYDDTDKVWLIRKYKDNQLHGECTGYYKNGNIKRKEKYENGHLKKGKCYTLSGRDTIYFPFEVNPEFRNGIDDLIQYLKDNVVYPKFAMENGIQGKVFVQFVVDKAGDVRDVIVIKKVSPLLDATAVDVVSKMPAWKPGRREGIPVNVQYILPVLFKIK